MKTAIRFAVSALLLVGAFVAVDSPVALGAERASICGPNPKSTASNKLPKQFAIMSPKQRLVGSGKLWTQPLGVPEYVAGGGWTRGKVPWFRLASGQLVITAHRVDGASGDFTAEIPPMSGYPVTTNAATKKAIGTGFMPSSLAFSEGGCWKVTAKLGRSHVVQYVDIDDSDQVICASLAKQLVDSRNLPDSEPTRQRTIEAITTDQGVRGCDALAS